MRPRSLPWLALHAFAIVAGTVSLVAALNMPSAALQTAYGQGGFAGRLLWVFIAAFAIKKLLQEYGGTGGTATTATNPAFVPTARPHTPFECDAIVAPAQGYRASPTAPVAGPSAYVNHQPAFPEPPAYGPGSTYVEAALPYGAGPQVYGAAPQVYGAPPQVYGAAPQAYGAAPQMRGSVAPPGR